MEPLSVNLMPILLRDITSCIVSNISNSQAIVFLPDSKVPSPAFIVSVSFSELGLRYDLIAF